MLENRLCWLVVSVYVHQWREVECISVSVFSLVISVTVCQFCWESLHLYVCLSLLSLLLSTLFLSIFSVLSGSRSDVWDALCPCVLPVFVLKHHACVWGHSSDCREWRRSNPRACVLFSRRRAGVTLCFTLRLTWTEGETVFISCQSVFTSIYILLFLD